MTDPRQPGRGDEHGSVPWYLRSPDADDHTGVARPRPARPGPYRPPADTRPPPPAETPWYLERPHRPSAPASQGGARKPAAAPQDTGTGKRKRLLPWLLAAGVGLALVTGIAIVVGGVATLGNTGGTVLDVAKVQTGVLQTLSDPASGYGANTVSDVNCNDGHNPSAVKGTTFTCDAIVNGSQRRVSVVVSDDNGTYEVDGPR